ncbi:MAG TPA: thiosulfate oxidation carrier complex protein SoxZ [Gammaproteobacteria bacterium]|nr:thiosulfate oxidation carrier complex protein SoxZ [Gammaproteobacteria bacterium]
MAEKIKPPRMRLKRRVKQNEIFKVKVRFDHPSFTGLGMVDENEERFNRARPSTFIRNMLVYYGEELVSRFRTSSAIADNPLFTFKLKAVKEAPVKIVFIDDQGERWETSEEVKFRT